VKERFTIQVVKRLMKGPEVSSQSELEKCVLDWFSAKGKHPSPSLVRSHVRFIFKAWEAEENSQLSHRTTD
jgi:hypothetical protein